MNKMMYRIEEEDYKYFKMFLAVHNLTYQAYIDTIVQKDLKAFKELYNKVAVTIESSNVTEESDYLDKLNKAEI